MHGLLQFQARRARAFLDLARLDLCMLASLYCPQDRGCKYVTNAQRRTACVSSSMENCVQFHFPRGPAEGTVWIDNQLKAARLLTK